MLPFGKRKGSVFRVQMKMEHGCHVSARWGDAKLDMPEAYVGGCLHYGSTLLYLANLIPSREQSCAKML